MSSSEIDQFLNIQIVEIVEMDPSERNPGFTANRHDYEMLDIIGQLTVLSCSLRKLLRLSIGFKAPYF